MNWRIELHDLSDDLVKEINDFFETYLDDLTPWEREFYESTINTPQLVGQPLKLSDYQLRKVKEMYARFHDWPLI